MYQRGMRKHGRTCIKGNEETGEEMRELWRICIKGEKVYQRKMGLNEEEDIMAKKRRRCTGSIWE
jgi:hypothetical protein